MNNGAHEMRQQQAELEREIVWYEAEAKKVESYAPEVAARLRKYAAALKANDPRALAIEELYRKEPP